MLKEMVMSATYRQQSNVNDELLQKDPYNKFYARGPRVRLTAEQVRDQALCVSGLLSSKMYGPGVMPFQPEGIWNSPYSPAQWKQSKGEDQYRRGVYIYWKRTAAYPSMTTLCVGFIPCEPKSSSVSTIPFPKICSHKRFTIVLAVNGCFLSVSHKARSSLFFLPFF